MRAFFSIVITCYNLEKYIAECINSVMTQNYDNYEIIIVDDGSTDKSPTIILDLAQRDSRIKFVKRENGGPGAARNTGIRHASPTSCRYLSFLDGDDRMKENTLLSVANMIEDAEYDLITCTKHIRVDANTQEINEYNLSRLQDYDELKCCLAKDTYLAHYFFKYSKLIENDRFFSEQKNFPKIRSGY